MTDDPREIRYGKAFQAFNAGMYQEALRLLDAVDQAQPQLADSFNLRGLIYMRERRFDEAEIAFQRAISLDRNCWNASFNLADAAFLKGDGTEEARHRFEALLSDVSSRIEPRTIELMRYKILLTYVREGNQSMTNWALNTSGWGKDSPVLYYVNAAIAFQHGDKEEASEWLTAASKQFTTELNALYAESLYELGWLEQPGDTSRAMFDIASASERSNAEGKALLEKAERAFQEGNLESAMEMLDSAQTGLPNEAAIENLRGEILMKQRKPDKAKEAFERALTLNPKLRESQYNLAEAALNQGEYAKARDQFEALLALAPADNRNQATQLMEYKIFLTLLLEEKEQQAQQIMNTFTFTDDTPALYYAKAAWEFKHGHAQEGATWLQSAQKIYCPALNMIFSDSLYDLGWLTKSEENASATATPTK